MGARVLWGADWIETSRTQSLRGVDYDCSAIPDAAMTAATVALFAHGRTRLRGIGSLARERDRPHRRDGDRAAQARATVETGPDWLALEGPVRCVRPKSIPMTIIGSPCASRWRRGGVSVEIRDPGCVSKTFPTFFQVLASVSAT